MTDTGLGSRTLARLCISRLAQAAVAPHQAAVAALEPSVQPRVCP